MKICNSCIRKKTLKVNLLKKDNHPRIYFIECGLATEGIKDCPYYQKKTIKSILKNL